MAVPSSPTNSTDKFMNQHATNTAQKHWTNRKSGNNVTSRTRRPVVENSEQSYLSYNRNGLEFYVVFDLIFFGVCSILQLFTTVFAVFWWPSHQICFPTAGVGKKRPDKVFLWPAKTVRKIHLEPRFPSRARPKSFFCLKINKSKYRRSLTYINLQAVMRISTSNLTPDFKKCDKVHLSH
jgi:hypothetical protein